MYGAHLQAYRSSPHCATDLVEDVANQITIELKPGRQDLRRMISELGRIGASENPYYGRTESEIAEQLLSEAVDATLRRLTEMVEARLATVHSAMAALEREASGARRIAPGSYTKDTLPPLGGRAQALLDSIWDGAEKGAGVRTAEKRKRGAKSRKPRGRLRLTDHGGDSVIEYLRKR